MKKRIAFLLVLTTLVSLLAACGSSDGANKKSQSANNNANNTDDGLVEVYLISKIVNYGTSYVFAYDEKGNMTECPVVGGGDSKLEYDENHRIIKRSWYLDGELRKYAQYIYDEQGRLAKEERYSQTGELGTTWEYVYNDQGLLAEYNAVATDGDVGMRRFYTYNEAGLLIEEKEEYYGDLNYRYTYTYDEQGNCTEFIFYSGSNEKKQHNLYTYDSDGKLLTEENTVSGGKSTLIYNSNGQLTEETYQGSETRKYVCTYDENGNLVKKDRSVNGEAQLPMEYQYIAVKLSREDAEIALKNMKKLLEEQGLAPLQR